jgi:2-polyprenyl-3-methyl-5-hydroxy-6-metoxy-1,4-benzoquinol methylase
METSAHLELVPCNLCGRGEFTVLFSSPFKVPDDQAAGDFVASTDRFDAYGQIVRCRGCGLVYTNPRPLPQVIAGGYIRSVDPEYASEDSSRSINAHMSLHVVRRFAKAGRLLDVGCNTGFFLNAARLDFEAHGVEPSEWASDFARSRLRLDVVTGTLDQAGFPPAHFDVVSMNDVVEHFTDPQAALRQVAGLIRPGGHLYLVTPNIASLSARLLRGRWWGLRPAHLYYFSPATLERMLRQAGFEVVLRKSYGRIFTWGYWLSRLQNYPAFVRGPVRALVKALGVESKFLYLDTRDSMEVVARRAEPE